MRTLIKDGLVLLTDESGWRCEKILYRKPCVSVDQKSAGGRFLPVLYTNADYKPSNECFKKAGYELKGKLCTVGRPEQ